MLLVDPNVGHSLSKTRAQRAQQMIDDLRRLGVPARLKRLKYGDVAFDGNARGGEVARIGIELKTIGGFLTDMTTGRFVGHQVPGMQRDFRYRYLFLEGTARPSPRDGILEILHGREWRPASPRMMYTAVVKFIDDICVRGGFEYRRTWGKLETIYTIAGIYGEWQKPWDKRKGMEHFDESGDTVMMGEPSLARRWAKELDKVGWVKSSFVERKFPTGHALANATERELAGVPGIGKTLARRAYREIRGLK